jgi:phenylalanyl-tRNA synthetase beta chain
MSCKGQNDLLQGVDFVDEYRGKGIPEGKKSVTIRLTIGSADRTLKTDEINGCANGVTKKLQKRLNAEMRG